MTVESYVKDSPGLWKLTDALHVVIGIEGEYSDKEEYVAGIFTDRQTAQNLILQKTAEGRQRATERNNWLVKMARLRAELKEKKVEAVSPEIMSYYGKDYLPRSLMEPTGEELAEIEQEAGPYPGHIEYDSYYIVAVPLNVWGRWEALDDNLEVAQEGR